MSDSEEEIINYAKLLKKVKRVNILYTKRILTVQRGVKKAKWNHSKRSSSA